MAETENKNYEYSNNKLKANKNNDAFSNFEKNQKKSVHNQSTIPSSKIAFKASDKNKNSEFYEDDDYGDDFEEVNSPDLKKNNSSLKDPIQKKTNTQT